MKSSVFLDFLEDGFEKNGLGFPGMQQLAIGQQQSAQLKQKLPIGLCSAGFC
jgi:hypothetical protein